MNTNRQLEIQAYVDGQLPAADARRVERQLTDDAEGAALAAHLRLVREIVREGEPVAEVPEARDFYFSQIKRRIASEETAAARAAAPETSSFNWIRSMLAPAAGVAMLTALAVLTLRERPMPFVAGKLEIASEEMSAFSFRSDQDQVTVVYLFDKQAGQTAHNGANTFAD